MNPKLQVVVAAVLSCVLSQSYADLPYSQFSFQYAADEIDLSTASIVSRTLESQNNALGFTFGFGELIGDTSRFEWNYEYYPKLADFYNEESEAYFQWSQIIGQNKVNRIDFSKSSMSFNFTMGLSDDIELVPYLMLGLGVHVLAANKPDARFDIPNDVVTASRFTFITLNYGAGFEGVINKYWVMDIGLRVNQGTHSLTATYRATNRITIDNYRSAGVYLSFRRYFNPNLESGYLE